MLQCSSENTTPGRPGSRVLVRDAAGPGDLSRSPLYLLGLSLLLLGQLCFIGPAFSREGGRAPAELKSLGEEALDLARQDRVDDAIAIWLDILDELSPQGRMDVHVNLAVAYLSRKRLPEAWYHLDANRRLAPAADPAVEKELTRVENELSTSHQLVSLQCEPKELRLFLDQGDSVPYPCPLRWYFPLGKETVVRGSAPGYLAGTTGVNPRPGMSVLMLKLVKEAAPAVPEISPDPSSDELVVRSEPPRKSSEIWKWSMLGGGVAMVTTAVILQAVGADVEQELRKKYPSNVQDPVLWQENKDNYNSEYEADVAPLQTASWVLFGTGGAAVATSLVILITDWSRPTPPEERTLAVKPLLSDDGFQMIIDWTF